MLRSVIKIAILCVYIFSIIGCSDADETEIVVSDDTEFLSLSQRRWLLQSFQFDSDEPIGASSDVQFTFTFYIDAEGVRSGFIGFDECNVFGTENILIDSNTLMHLEGVSFDTGCDSYPADVVDQATFFLAVITDTFVFEESDSELTIRSLTGQTLTFVACIPDDPDSVDSFCEPL